MSGPFHETPEGFMLAVRVTPKASADAITGLYTDAAGALSLSVKVTAAPDKGRANAAVIKLLSEELGIPKSSLVLASGETSRLKRIAISGNAAALRPRIEAFRARHKV